MTAEHTEAIGTTEPRPDRTREVRPCTVFGCVDMVHAYMDGEKDDLCFSIGIGDSGTKDNPVWYVAGYRDEDSGVWAAYTDPPEFDTLEGPTGLTAIERFALAYRAVQAHCEMLNARSTALATVTS